MDGQHRASGLERYVLYALVISALCVSPLVFIVLLNDILLEQPGYHWYERLSVLTRSCLAFLIFSSISAYAAACFVGGMFEALRNRRARREAMEERNLWHPGSPGFLQMEKRHP
jgi:hypothetical protein